MREALSASPSVRLLSSAPVELGAARRRKSTPQAARRGTRQDKRQVAVTVAQIAGAGDYRPQDFRDVTDERRHVVGEQRICGAIVRELSSRLMERSDGRRGHRVAALTKHKPSKKGAPRWQ
jgi:hypothetical protein